MKNAPLKKTRYIPLSQSWMNCYECFCRAPLERPELHDAVERGEVERVQRLLSTGSLNINSSTVIVSISIMASVNTICSYISDIIVCCSGCCIPTNLQG